METVKDTDRDAELRQQFGDMVHATEKFSHEIARPWKLATGVLSVALVVVLLWHK